jgi:SAM-dependent methyltransferase
MTHVTNPRPRPDSYDQIAEIYDEDMGCSAPGADVDFYTRACAGLPGPVLELGCGTGRVSLPLARAGARVLGLDASLPMLRVLRRKAAGQLTAGERARLRAVHMDMREAAFGARFAAVLCPYSAFTYLVEEPEQLRVLRRVRAHLAPGGRFLLDVFVPDPAVRALPAGHVFHDYRRPRADGTLLERTKTIAQDVAPGVNVITRRYRFLTPAGAEIRRLVTTERIRYWYPDDLERLLRRAGFAVLEVRGDFAAGPPGPGTRTAAFVCGAPG